VHTAHGWRLGVESEWAWRVNGAIMMLLCLRGRRKVEERRVPNTEEEGSTKRYLSPCLRVNALFFDICIVPIFNIVYLWMERKDVNSLGFKAK
jgi:hypothetical protein